MMVIMMRMMVRTVPDIKLGGALEKMEIKVAPPAVPEKKDLIAQFEAPAKVAVEKKA